MTPGDDETTARAIVADLQERVDARDLDRLTALFPDDAVLIGSAGFSTGRDAVRDYLGLVLGQEASLRWDLPELHVFHRAEGLIGFAARGEVVLTDDDEEDRSPFRLTVVAVDSPEGWKVKQFHGSLPSDF